MNKLVSLGIGFAVGAAIGATMVVLFAPVSGERLIHSLKVGYAETMQGARLASENRKRELEAEFARMRGQTITPYRLPDRAN
jgi:gas vesicle protein